MRAIVVSKKDPAGMNMFNFFTEKFKLTSNVFDGNTIFEYKDMMLVRVNTELVYADNLKDLDCDEIIFASRHSSAAGEPALAAHICGNFGPNDLGGEVGKLSIASANTMRNIFQEMSKCSLDFQVTMEATHHGPYLDTPHCWIELGSDEVSWKNEEAAEFLANSIIKGLENTEVTPTAIGLGGGHYSKKFNQFEGEFAFGHILPKYNQEFLNKKMVEYMIERTTPTPETIFIDKKGISNQSKVQEMLKDFDLRLI